MYRQQRLLCLAILSCVLLIVAALGAAVLGVFLGLGIGWPSPPSPAVQAKTTGSSAETTLTPLLPTEVCTPNPCYHGGSCSSAISDLTVFTCSCLPGWSGSTCLTAPLVCAQNPCLNDGTCFQSASTFNCSCQPGWSGNTCFQASCSPSPCYNGGSCYVSNNSYVCTCLPGWTRLTCSQAPRQCSPNPCQNGGTCYAVNETFGCLCVPGWSGEMCSVDLCSPNPCYNGGKCSHGKSGYECTCLSGWTGSNCSLAPRQCGRSPCQNGGTCFAVNDTYGCLCPRGWIGENCSQDLCSPNPCYNGGSCSYGVSDYFCTCLPGWTGSTCLQAPHQCYRNPCQNGGTCFAYGSSFNCRCTSEWGGQTCSQDSVKTTVGSTVGSFRPTSASVTKILETTMDSETVISYTTTVSVTTASLATSLAPNVITESPISLSPTSLSPTSSSSLSSSAPTPSLTIGLYCLAGFIALLIIILVAVLIKRWRDRRDSIPLHTSQPPNSPSSELGQRPAAPELPDHWLLRHTNLPVAKVLLKSDDDREEYEMVVNNCRKTAGQTITEIISIYRIERRDQYLLFLTNRANLLQKIGDSQQNDAIERLLWHGTSENYVDSICTGGFNRIYSGFSNAASYGKGAYFAVKFSYSAQDRYSVPGTNGHKHIFQCRVLVGRYTTGSPDFIEAPLLPHSSTERYDSVVDNLTEPTLFVIFRDAQAYPEYLIVFR